MEFLTNKFAAIVVPDFGGTRVVTQPVCIEMDGAGFRVGPVCTCIEHSEDVDFGLAFSSNGIILDSYCPWAGAVNVYLFKGFLSRKAETMDKRL